MFYEITFMDETEYRKYSEEGKWNDVPDKPIKSLTYHYGSESFTLAGYNAYNHVIKLGLGINNNISGILFIMIMAKAGGKVVRKIYNPRLKQLITDEVAWGKEYNGHSHVGWKRGV